MNSKLKVGVLVVILIGAVSVFQSQRMKIERLGAEVADARAKLAHAASLQETNDLLSTELQAAVERSETNQRELTRLRGGAVKLRQLEQEIVELKARVQQSQLGAPALQAAIVDKETVEGVTRRIHEIKTGIVDFYAKNNALPAPTTYVEGMLASEGLLEDSPYSSHIRTRVLSLSEPTDAVELRNGAYNLDGNGTNNVIGKKVVESVVLKVTAAAARELNRMIDGEMNLQIGEADLKGRVKYDAIPLDGFGEVHCYITHR